MKAMVSTRCAHPDHGGVPATIARPGEIRVAVEACAVCRTDLHVVDGDLPHPKPPHSRP